jgi:hypothetical protein
VVDQPALQLDYVAVTQVVYVVIYIMVLLAAAQALAV